MAGTLALALMGRRSVFTGAEMPVRLKVDGIEVATYGDFQGEGDTFSWNSSEASRRIVVRDGRLVGATSVGGWIEAGRVQEMIERGARVSPRLCQRFEQAGRFWKDESVPHISQWPAAAVVCNCTGVRRGELSAACDSGCTTVEQLARQTGASTVCGSCKPLLADMLGTPPESVRVPGMKLLGAAAAVTAVLALLTAILRPIPFAVSVQDWMHRIDVLWREEFWKQLTGYTVAGLALVSLGLSLRKRIKAVRWGAFGHWRAVHAALGACTLVALVSHTGLRLGHNMNFILMTNFLALALAGALAGAVVALERRLSGPAGKRLRSCWTAAHIALAWPLPVLVFFHVLAAYYF
jgi:nitrite reductase (NADH) large subunit